MRERRPRTFGFTRGTERGQPRLLETYDVREFGRPVNAVGSQQFCRRTQANDRPRIRDKPANLIMARFHDCASDRACKQLLQY